jgi:transcriptional regulator with XRE-family HTH domain
MERLEHLLTLAGISARFACRLAGLPETFISRVKSDGSEPVARNAIALAQVFGTTADYLFAGHGAAPTPDQIRVAVQAAQEAAARKAVAA